MGDRGSDAAMAAAALTRFYQALAGLFWDAIDDVDQVHPSLGKAGSTFGLSPTAQRAIERKK
jgi:hypothetical protein